jgi:glutaredoxin
MQEVTIYSKPNCTQCTMAKNIMKSKGIQYSEVEFDVGQPQVPGKTVSVQTADRR